MAVLVSPVSGRWSYRLAVVMKATAATQTATSSAAVELDGICCGVPVTSLPPGDMQERPSVVGTPVPSVEGFTFGVAERGGSVRSS